MIPYSVGFKTWRQYPSISAAYRQVWSNRLNAGKNAFSMRHIAMSDAFPGTKIDNDMGVVKSIYHYLKNIFKAQSLKSSAWVAPLRQEALERYIKLNTTLMQKSPRITDLTSDAYQTELTELVRKRDPEHLYRWTFHREVTPTRIVSLRAADGHYGKDLPETGCRVAVQALVRFDTEQSVEIYDKHGRPLHTPAGSASLLANADGEGAPRVGSKALQIVPAQRKRVTEYLVLDKPMYIPGAQWKFRARFVPTPGKTPAV
ncbi:hypothetical protein FB45DRAFT_476503 [Roridomyces roridus]|uniref:Uncharacterized protein n=1 Tax=Roridomyces roridus TaxID=1738132 RepID=A0AAD7BZF7_9AGAR|nr:hypothetical protein FB45DRAFT_476503 [Roridomyces roridus]